MAEFVGYASSAAFLILIAWVQRFPRLKYVMGVLVVVALVCKSAQGA